MNMQKCLAVCVAMILAGAAGGCGSEDGTIEASRTEVEKQQALRDSTFGSLAGTIDQAHSVEQLNEDRKRNLDDAIENSGDH